MASQWSYFDIPPSAARLTGSLRDIGYDFHTAVADLVDNSIAAGASQVDVELVFDPNASYVLISDDGEGMTPAAMLEALRFGSRRDYAPNELGRFGLGLKTGSFSQCRRLSVVSRHTPVRRTCTVRTIDLDYVERVDAWAVLADEGGPGIEAALNRLEERPGTVVVWENLDRVLPDRYAESGWGRRRMASLAKKTAEHLSMVFHRFIAGSTGTEPVTISVNDEKLDPWDPFAGDEKNTISLEPEIFELELEDGSSDIAFRGYVLPPRDKFSTPERFEHMSGPLKWNRQQGLYIYRANRLVQFGGWNGLRGIDEHTKLARASIDFDTDLDETFQINVAKMSVVLPATLKNMLERPIHDLCVRADAAYRQSPSDVDSPRSSPKSASSDSVALREVGVALKAALLESQDLPVFREALNTLRQRHPDLATSLGL
ncbi:ATP-binding protein [Nakamurella lactea]|uniref:ATP-binding protein n=1 Tax=Nakamurella lactea TaxID=459515 RepID=UPI0004133D53|nr:ATP-binding protein [Nakamurella lactea]